MPRLGERQIEEAISRYRSGETGPAIAASLGVNHTSIYRVLRRHGEKSRDASTVARRYRCDERYFDVISDEGRAYWLGFISADGCVMERPGSPVLSVMLKAEDAGHVDKLRTALSATQPVRLYDQSDGARHHPAARLQIVSARLVGGLARHGVSPRKSSSLTPPAIDPVLLRHYWRGYFDGDGSIRRMGRQTGTPQWRASCIGNEAVIRSFAGWLAEHADVSSDRVYPDRRGSLWFFDYGGNRQVRRILAQMYEGATVSLDRKRALYEAI